MSPILDLRRAGPRALILAAFACVAPLLAGCDMQGALDGTKGFLDRSAKSIDGALGVAAPARYDLLTPEDKAMAGRAMQTALETRNDGASLAWRNTKTGNSGTVTPLATYVSDDGAFCRKYKEVVVIGTEQGEATNTGCRAGPKTWRAVG